MTKCVGHQILDRDLSYEPVSHLATHGPTGLAIRWLRDDPPMERTAFFTLTYKDTETPFTGHYDYDDAAKKAAFPGLDSGKLWAATRDWNKMNFVSYGYEFQMLGVPPVLFVRV